MDIGALLGGLFNPFSEGSPISAIGNAISNPYQTWDRFKNGMTNEVNKQIADENLQYQRERNEIEDARYEEETAYNRGFAEDERAYNRAFAEDERAYQRNFAADERAYQRALQQQIFEREDTAIERQASQLSKLGINPLSQNMSGLASGSVVSASSPGSSSVAGATAPNSSARGGSALHNGFTMQDTGDLSALMGLFQGLNDLQTGNLSRDAIREQNDYQRLLNQAQALENAQKAEELKAKLENTQADTENKKANTKTTEEMRPSQVKNSEATANRNAREDAFQEKYNVSDGTDKYVRIMTDIANQTDTTGLTDPSVRTKDSFEKQQQRVKDNYRELANNAFVKPLKTVGKVLENSIGKTVGHYYEYLKDKFTRPKPASRERLNRSRR